MCVSRVCHLRYTSVQPQVRLCPTRVPTLWNSRAWFWFVAIWNLGDLGIQGGGKMESKYALCASPRWSSRWPAAVCKTEVEDATLCVCDPSPLLLPHGRVTWLPSTNWHLVPVSCRTMHCCRLLLSGKPRPRGLRTVLVVSSILFDSRKGVFLFCWYASRNLLKTAVADAGKRKRCGTLRQ